VERSVPRTRFFRRHFLLLLPASGDHRTTLRCRHWLWDYSPRAAGSRVAAQGIDQVRAGFGAFALSCENRARAAASHRPASAYSLCDRSACSTPQKFANRPFDGRSAGRELGCCGRAGPGDFRSRTRKVKQAIVGYGAAQKTAVAKMVQRMLRLAHRPRPTAGRRAGAGAYSCARKIPGFSLTPPKRI